MTKTIWGNTIVKNEDKYIWFSINSVVKYLDKILVWDTGSTDNTVEIIKLIQKKYPDKIIFKQVGEVDSKGLTQLRQEMLIETKSDWLLLVDGDEVWFKEGIKEVLEIIQKSNLEAVVTPVINLIGDIYHYQEEAAGQYEILGKKGHFNVRAINRRIPGLHIKNDYPLEGFYDGEEVLIQSKGKDKLEFQQIPLLHFTYLSRSSSKESAVLLRTGKNKSELGEKFPKGFNYPEVFFEEYPRVVMSPWVNMPVSYKVRAFFETPLRKLKRRI